MATREVELSAVQFERFVGSIVVPIQTLATNDIPVDQIKRDIQMFAEEVGIPNVSADQIDMITVNDLSENAHELAVRHKGRHNSLIINVYKEV